VYPASSTFSQRLTDDLGQPARCRDRLGPAFLHDKTGDPARCSVLTKPVNQISQRFFVCIIHYIGSGTLQSFVNSHVQGHICLKTEPEAGIRQLRRANTQIRQYEIDLLYALVVELLADLREIRVKKDDLAGQRPQFSLGPLDGILINIHTDDNRLGAQSFAEQKAVTSLSYGRIDDHAV
jgi:hypothetical protein